MPEPTPITPSSSSPLVKATDLRMEFPDTLAVDDLTFELKAGSILGLIGPNGAGKTTTLRMLAGILPPGGGRIEIAGFDLDREPLEAKRRLAYIPDDPRLFDALTVWEHIRFTASLYRLPEYDDRATALLERFDLSEKKHAVCGELSRGMRHKVGICCALLHEPYVLMFDEPLTGLDPRAIREIKEIVRLRAAAGAGLILSSHLLHLVEDICTEILVMQGGRRRYYGDLAGLRAAAKQDSSKSLEEVFLAVTGEREQA